MATKEKIANLTYHLSTATGYSKVYCRKVVEGDRSADSKGGKIIMEKYKSLEQLLDEFYSAGGANANNNNELLTQ